jgi:hypothetical protein
MQFTECIENINLIEPTINLEIIKLKNKISKLEKNIKNEATKILRKNIGELYDPIEISNIIEKKYNIENSHFKKIITSIKDSHQHEIFRNLEKKREKNLETLQKQANSIIKHFKEVNFKINKFQSIYSKKYYEEYSLELTKNYIDVNRSSSCTSSRYLHSILNNFFDRTSLCTEMQILAIETDIFNNLMNKKIDNKSLEKTFNEINEISKLIELFENYSHSKNISENIFLPTIVFNKYIKNKSIYDDNYLSDLSFILSISCFNSENLNGLDNNFIEKKYFDHLSSYFYIAQYSLNNIRNKEILFSILAAFKLININKNMSDFISREKINKNICKSNTYSIIDQYVSDDIINVLKYITKNVKSKNLIDDF